LHERPSLHFEVGQETEKVRLLYLQKGRPMKQANLALLIAVVVLFLLWKISTRDTAES